MTWSSRDEGDAAFSRRINNSGSGRPEHRPTFPSVTTPHSYPLQPNQGLTTVSDIFDLRVSPSGGLFIFSVFRPWQLHVSPTRVAINGQPPSHIRWLAFPGQSLPGHLLHFSAGWVSRFLSSRGQLDLLGPSGFGLAEGGGRIGREVTERN